MVYSVLKSKNYLFRPQKHDKFINEISIISNVQQQKVYENNGNLHARCVIGLASLTFLSLLGKYLFRS